MREPIIYINFDENNWKKIYQHTCLLNDINESFLIKKKDLKIKTKRLIAQMTLQHWSTLKISLLLLLYFFFWFLFAIYGFVGFYLLFSSAIFL